MKKLYFHDLGIRNTLIDNLAGRSKRNDLGQIWGNLLIAERRKSLSYLGRPAQARFWRIYTGAELDCVEEREGTLAGFQIRSGTRKARIPHSWLETYPGASGQIVGPENWLEFLIPTSA
jgi:predicted AAA+ superfamily ATPase